MTRHICAAAVAAELGSVQLWVDGLRDDFFSAELSKDFGVQYYSQVGDDLGQRMNFAVQEALRSHVAVLLIGSDCPFLDPAYLNRAAACLSKRDAVIGPATDGGYVLLGLRKLSLALFENVPWGSDRVCAVTEQRLKSLGWSYSVLEALADIDRPEDLSLLAHPSLPADLNRFSEPRNSEQDVTS